MYKTRTVYKENTVYVPVYDDPFWNPEADGRLAGEVRPPPFRPRRARDNRLRAERETTPSERQQVTRPRDWKRQAADAAFVLGYFAHQKVPPPRTLR